MKMYISKYALTSGIIEADLEYIEGEKYAYYVKEYHQSFAVGTNAFKDRADALKAAEKLRTKKIESLKKQIANLDRMTFL